MTLPLGECRTTPAAAEAAQRAGVDLPRLLARHAGGDWGDLGRADWALNDRAARDGERVLSSYEFGGGVTLWVLTEGDRSRTTLMLPGQH